MISKIASRVVPLLFALFFSFTTVYDSPALAATYHFWGTFSDSPSNLDDPYLNQLVGGSFNGLFTEHDPPDVFMNLPIPLGMMGTIKSWNIDLNDKNGNYVSSIVSGVGYDYGEMTNPGFTRLWFFSPESALPYPVALELLFNSPFNGTGDVVPSAYDGAMTSRLFGGGGAYLPVAVGQSAIPAPVPEPSTMLLLGSGLLGLVGYGRRRFKN